MQMEELIKATGAELVGGNLITGIGPTRKVVGVHDENGFSLNEEGQALLKKMSEPVVEDTDVSEEPVKRKLVPRVPVRSTE